MIVDKSAQYQTNYSLSSSTSVKIRPGRVAEPPATHFGYNIILYTINK